MNREKVIQTFMVLIAALLSADWFFELSLLRLFALLLSLLVLFFPWLAEKIALFWIKLGNFLGYINSIIVLTLIFYLLLCPLALLYRLFNPDKLQIRRKPRKSLFVERNKEFTPSDFEKPF